MLNSVLDLACNVGHALEICPPDYIRSILGNPDSWCSFTCPPTELQLAEPCEWDRGVPALVHILIPALPWKAPRWFLPCCDLFFRPSEVFRYPGGSGIPNPTPAEEWFFINGICTNRSVVEINARYLHRLFGRPLTILHNFTRGWLPDLAACAVGKEWDRVTESVAVAFPYLYSAVKRKSCRKVILLAHSQGTILSAVMLELFKALRPRAFEKWIDDAVISPERAVARKLADRWDFGKTRRTAATFEAPGVGRCHPEPVTLDELRKLEIYASANCATEMIPVEVRGGTAAPYIESYGNEKDIVARLGLLANATGPGSVHIGGDRYRREGAWGHLLNAHYLYPMMRAREQGSQSGGLVPFAENSSKIPRLFEYLDARSPERSS